MMIYSEQDCAAYMNEIVATHDLLLQAWRTSPDMLEHVASISGSATVDYQTIFDAGCGTGQFLHIYKMLNPSAACIGMNLFKCQLKLCKDYEIVLVQGDIRTDISDVYDGKCDKVFCHYTLGHFDDEEAAKLVKRLARMLRPKGELVMWDIMQKNVAVDEILGYRLRTSARIHRFLNEAGLASQGKLLKASLASHFDQITDAETVKSFAFDTLPMLHIGTKPESNDGRG